MSDNNDNCGQTAGQCCRSGLQRRTVLQGMAVIGGAAALTSGPAFAQDDPAGMPPQVGDFLSRNSKGTPLTVDDVRAGAKPVEVYAVSPDGVLRNSNYENALLVAKFEDADLSEEAKKTAVEGILVYSAICTHAGCEVTGWIREDMTLECPCHGSHFDPKNNGAVIFGPAARKLPQIGIKVEDGKIIVASGYDSRVGGDETM